ncbi:MAG: hypothetical protein B7733_16465 [Myxococcales bacterium FL481]|nr:MAG: hypothetical protein B7733_16465 [Myxococcales bacterium FL481]
MMSIDDTFAAVSWLFAWAVSLQTVELARLRHRFRAGGAWDFAVFSDPRAPRLIPFACVCGPFPQVLAVISLRGVAAVLLAADLHPLGATTVLATTLVLAWRFRGPVNGGSDAMTTIVATALCVASWTDHPKWRLGALWYISIQIILSYWLAGWAKLRADGWRRGHALPTFLRQACYNPRGFSQWLLARPRLARVAGWVVVGFELAFPVVLVFPSALPVMLVAGVGFHAVTVYALGLTRFLWVWVAGYPALTYCVGQFSSDSM